MVVVAAASANEPSIFASTLHSRYVEGTCEGAFLLNESIMCDDRQGDPRTRQSRHKLSQQPCRRGWKPQNFGRRHFIS